MKCPKCNVQMKPETYKEIEVDQCEICNGIWLDRGEMEAILESDLGNIIDLETTSELSDIYNEIPAHCPSCDKPMMSLMGAADIHFDWCDHCESIFFDAGELRKLQNFEGD